MSARARVSDEDGIGFLARLGLLVGFLFVLLLAAIYGWRTGWMAHEAQHVEKNILDLTKDAKFEVKDIILLGRRQSSKADVLDALGTSQGSPILGVDTYSAATKLEKLPWVDSVKVERRLPDTVVVRLSERIPTARWQHDEKLYVIDSNGHVLPSAKAEDFASLPLVVGAGADKGAKAFFAALKNYPDIRAKMTSAVRVGERRWDLHMPPRVTIRLPEDNIDNALHRLSVLIGEEKILEREIVAVDLRMNDRLILEPAVSPKQVGDTQK